MLETSEKIESFINKCRITKNQTESLKELKNITTKKKKKNLIDGLKIKMEETEERIN